MRVLEQQAILSNEEIKVKMKNPLFKRLVDYTLQNIEYWSVCEVIRYLKGLYTYLHLDNYNEVEE